MEDQAPAPLITEVYSRLAAERPFTRSLVFGDDTGDEGYFYQTVDIRRVIRRFQEFKKHDLAIRRKRLMGVYANIGDGKTTFLSFLQHLEREPSILPVMITALNGEGGDPSRIVLDLVWHLLYELKQRGKLGENRYNEATLEFKGAQSDPDTRHIAIENRLREVYLDLRGMYLVWLCDNVAGRSCLRAFQHLLYIRDSEPPSPRFFGEIPVLIVFSTSDPDLREAWREDPNREASGHELNRLAVSAEDMAEMVKRILHTHCEDLPESLREGIATLRERNPAFPIYSQDLELFLKQKAAMTELGRGRHGLNVEVTEIQLRNTLELLQRVVDSKAREGSDQLISIRELMGADLGG